MKYLLFIVGLSIPLYVIRFSIGGIPTNVMEVVIIIAGLIMLLQQGIYRSLLNPKTYQYKGVRIFAILLALATIAVIVSGDLRASLGILKGYFMIPALLLVILAQFKQEQYQFLIRGIIGSGLMVAMITIVQVLFSGFDNGFRPNALYALGLDPAVSQGGFSNYIAMYLIPIFIVSLSRQYVSVHFRYFVGSILLGGILLTQSYAGIFALLGVFLVWILTQYRSRNMFMKIVKSYLSILVIIGLILFGLWQINTPKFQSLLDMDNRNSITTRVQIWDTSLTMIQRNPLVGIGLADFQRVYTETIPTKYFPPYEWLVPQPHNLYFAFWLQLGLGGIIWLLYILVYCVRRYREAIRENDWELYWLNLSLLSIFIYGILDTPFWKNDLALLFLVILYGIIAHKKDSNA